MSLWTPWTGTWTNSLKVNNAASINRAEGAADRETEKELFIYYLEGRVARDTELNFEGFMGNWEEDGYSFLFFDRASGDAICRILSEQPQIKLLDEYRMAYTEWLGTVPKTLHAGGWTILPEWHRCPRVQNEEASGNTIRLDPGVVFGSGTHSTTADCLKALEMAFSLHRPATVIDLGTGTGILALLAAGLGSRQTLAVDLNLLAVKTARKNIRQNGMASRILAVQGKAEEFIDIPADLVMANIHYEIMKRILEAEGFYRKKLFILSGLLRSQAKTVETTLTARKGLRLMHTWSRDGVWHTFFGMNSEA